MPNPKKGVAYTFSVSLLDAADTRALRANPTLATGDVKVSVDDGAYANITTLPTVTPAGGTKVKVSLSAAEMNGDRIDVQFIDQTATKEWTDRHVAIEPTTVTVDDLVRSTTPANALNVNASGQADATVVAMATGVITAGVIAADAIGASELAADAVTEIQAGLATSSALTSVAGDVTAILADTAAIDARLPSDPADASDIAASFASVASTLATIAAFIDTEVAAIKAKTDQLVFTNAGKVDAAILAAADLAQAAADKVLTSTFAFAELTGAPPATPTLREALMLDYMFRRNRFVDDKVAALLKLYNDAGTVFAKSTITEGGGVYERAELVNGP